MRRDIPAFYSNWFFNRISQGFVLVRNHYNKKIFKYNLTPNIVDCLCFCTKNPTPMLKKLNDLSDFNQFWFVTINPYEKDVEVNVPYFKKIIKSFKKLSNNLGINKISWRYDHIS